MRMHRLAHEMLSRAVIRVRIRRWLRMAKVKNQHTVPQSYLRRFAVQRDMIWVFDKVTRRSFLTNVRNVASEAGFYDFDTKSSHKLLRSKMRMQAR
jgi:uncharacterized protein DUF4238